MGENFGGEQEDIVTKILEKILKGQSKVNALEIIRQCNSYISVHPELYKPVYNLDNSPIPKSLRHDKFLEDEMFVSGNGLTWHFPPEDLPNKEEVKLCEVWINKFIEKRKTINKEYSSYGLKHFVERHFKTYCSNGAFIQASINLGFELKEVGLNAYFNMGLVKWERFLKEEVKYNGK